VTTSPMQAAPTVPGGPAPASRAAVMALTVAVAVLAAVCAFLLVQNHQQAEAIDEAYSQAEMADLSAHSPDQDTLDAVSFLCAKVARLQRMNGLSAIGASDASGDGDPCAVISENS
jgi:uncharacterized protein HemX